MDLTIENLPQIYSQLGYEFLIAPDATDGQILTVSAGRIVASAPASGSVAWTDITGVTPTAAEINFVDGVTSAIQTQIDGKQPLDSDLTAIAALTTTAYGRALLELANQAALLTAIGATGTTSQYLRGDASLGTLNQAAVAGLTTASTPTFAGATLTGALTGTSATFSNDINLASGKKVNWAAGDTAITHGPSVGQLNIGTSGQYPLLYVGGTSSSVACIVRRTTTAASFYFGEDADAGGTIFRGVGGLSSNGASAGGIAYVFRGQNYASSGTNNKARLTLAPHSGYTNTTAPYVEGFNTANDAGLTFGTYNSGLSEKMRLAVSGALLINTTTDDGSNKLQVNGNLSCAAITASGQLNLGTTGNPVISSGSSGSNQITFQGGAGNISIATNGSSGVIVMGSGRLGLGDTHRITWHNNADGTGSGVTNVSQQSAGVVQIGTTSANALGSLACAAITASGLMQLGVYTFGTVPSASSNTGKILRISDRAQKHAYSDGTDWRFFGDDAIIS